MKYKHFNCIVRAPPEVYRAHQIVNKLHNVKRKCVNAAIHRWPHFQTMRLLPLSCLRQLLLSTLLVAVLFALLVVVVVFCALIFKQLAHLNVNPFK